MNDKSKIAVIFPGIGYHCDKPLLYYTKKLAVNAGYEVKDVPYGGFADGIKGSPEKMAEAYKSALSQAEDILKNIEWVKYDDILFVSKSVGTAVAASYAGNHNINTRNVFFTPVEQSFKFMKDEGIVFTGTNDPWVRKDIVPEKCRQLGYTVHLIDNANHSLETGSTLKDIENMLKIMEIVEKYIQ